MKIAHVLDSLETGGAERVVLTLAAIQQRQGHAVEVHTLYRNGPLQQNLDALAIPVYLAGGATGFQITRNLARNLKSTRPDVLHMHNATATIFGAAAALLARVPVRISTRHGLSRIEGKRKQEAKYWAATRFCQSIVAVSSAAAVNLRTHPLSQPAKVSVIINGAAPAATSPDEPVPPSPDFTFIHVARLHAVKDQTTLLQAFAEALRRNPGLRLILIGDGELRTSLEQLAAQLRITGHVLFAGERRFVGNWLAAAGCFVLSSRSEATPVSLLEALAAGLPCIVTDVGEMPVIVRTAECGATVPPAAPSALAQAMLHIATLSSDERDALSANARAAYLARFQPEAMASAYSQHYRQGLTKADGAQQT